MAESAALSSHLEETVVDVLIVGAGFSGLCMAIKLKEAGITNFLVIEKDEDIGGTWWENTYPGCACDIPSHLYCFSFDRNPEWSRMYPPAREIHAYMRRCAEKYGVMPFIRLNTSLKEATWNDAERRWKICTGGGGTITARVLISGMGALHVPHYPEIKGLETFSGPTFHSSNWDHEVDLVGKSIAVVGTGASAIQFVPEIQPTAGKLYLFQRSPAWIMPKPDRPIAEKAKRRFRSVPGAMRLNRAMLFWAHELRVYMFLGNKKMQEGGKRMALGYIERKVKDPVLRAKLTPSYEIGCKRVLISNNFYQAVSQPNVELIAEPIAELRERSIVTSDGVERPIDVLIHGTGFRATEPLLGTRIIGRGGVEIHDAWRERVSAYLGMTVSGFPNLFLLLGPNTGLGHNSVILMIEAQVRYIVSCLKLMRSRDAETLEVKGERQARFVQEIRDGLKKTVWQSGGCMSWYQDKSGENPTLWPGSVVGYQRATRSVKPDDYVLAD